LAVPRRFQRLRQRLPKVSGFSFRRVMKAIEAATLLAEEGKA
jgi:hypothetical protein